MCLCGNCVKKEMAIPLAIPLIMAAASAASSIYSGAKSSEANREAQDRLAAEKAATESERRRAKYQSWTDTASGQNTLRMLQRQADRYIKQAQGAAAVGGGTEASIAREKELQNQRQAEVIAQANADFEARKDNVDASYRQQLQGIAQQQIAAEQSRAQAIAQAASGVSSALMQGAISTFGGTKIGQQWMAGTGSPGGSGVAPADGYASQAPTQLQQMGVDNPAETSPGFYRNLYKNWEEYRNFQPFMQGYGNYWG